MSFFITGFISAILCIALALENYTVWYYSNHNEQLGPVSLTCANISDSDTVTTFGVHASSRKGQVSVSFALTGDGRAVLGFLLCEICCVVDLKAWRPSQREAALQSPCSGTLRLHSCLVWWEGPEWPREDGNVRVLLQPLGRPCTPLQESVFWSGKRDFDLVEPLFSRLKAYGSLILTCQFVSIAKGILLSQRMVSPSPDLSLLQLWQGTSKRAQVFCK